MSEIFDKSLTFDQLDLNPDVLKGVARAGYQHPTAIQAQLIPVILEGCDVIGQAKTGTGKTASFGLPLLHAADPVKPMQALVLTPTRELAAQVASELDELGNATRIRTTCIIGGMSMKKQIDSVKGGGHIIVGTPGRVMDLHSRHQIHFDNIRFVVLDEVDRMLDIGFRDDIRRILKLIQQPHQTIFVSATITEEIERLARTFMKPDARKITVVSGSLTVEQVEQYHLPVEPWDKKHLLLHLIRHEKPETLLVFCRTKATVSKIAKYLSDKGIDAREIHGDMGQKQRNRVMSSMREGNIRVLIASDLAARGLDVEHITHVINYDLPEDPDIYVHRIGRTARAGRRGVAWSFVSPDEGRMLTEIEKLAGVLIGRYEYPDFEPGPVPDDVKRDRAVEAGRRTRSTTDPAAFLAERSLPPSLEGLSEEQIKAMFPDGNIPQQLPRRNLGARFRTRRSR